MCRTKPEFRKRSVTQKVKRTVSQVTELMANSKMNMKWNQNPQRNTNERVTKTIRKRRKKEKQHPELVSLIANESTPKSKANAGEKIENEDLPAKLVADAMFCSRHMK